MSGSGVRGNGVEEQREGELGEEESASPATE